MQHPPQQPGPMGHLRTWRSAPAAYTRKVEVMKELPLPEVARITVPKCACPTDGVIELVGKKWTLCLLATVANKQPIRFNRLQEELGTVSPKTLSDTLSALQKHGILSREAHAEVPPRGETRSYRG